MNIIPSFHYRFKEFLRGAAALMIFYTLAMTIFAISISFGSGRSNFSGFEISAAITVFVFGIVTIREDLRLGIQNGVSRRSVFLATLLSSVLVALIIAAAGDLIVMAIQKVTLNNDRLYTAGLYQLLYSTESAWFHAPLPQHFGNILFTFTLLIFANFFGSLISLVFFRLNKRWTVIVAVGAPLLLFWVLPLILARANLNIGVYFVKIAATPLSITAFFAACAALTAVFNFLLIRRAPIQAQVK